MSKITVKVVNQKQFDDRIKGQSARVKSNLIRVVNLASNEIRNIAVRNILSNARTGGTVTRYNPKRTINISSAGDYPASDTGFLANQIAVKIDAGGFGADVISNADYSEALEFGTIKMKARPFMQPSAEEAKKKYRLDSINAINKGLK